MSHLNARFILVVMMVLGCSGQALAQDGLERAYKKEFTYLEAQKRALGARLKAVKSNEGARVRKAQGALNRVQGRLLGLTVQADKVEAQLLDAERKVSVATDQEDALKATLDQARATLTTHGATLPAVSESLKDPTLKASAQTTAILDAFDKGLGVLDQWQTIRASKSHMFLPDGARVPATIIRIGNIAAYGVSAQGAGALAPAGGKRLKLWPEDASQTARAFASGSRPKTVKLFLFESLEKNIEPRKEKTALETVDAGGLVAWVIVVLGAIGFALVILRVLIFALASFKGRGLLSKLEPLISNKRFDEAATMSAARGALGRVVAATCEAISRERDEIDNAVAEAILRESPSLERFGTAIMVFAAVAPLLGLLGTVTGMISTFDVITEFGTGDPKMLSGGISEALITTQLGLVVAIPLLLLGNLTNSMANTMLTSFERSALFVINRAGVASEPDTNVMVSDTTVDTHDAEGQALLGGGPIGAV